jgi:hypothetical protein
MKFFDGMTMAGGILAVAIIGTCAATVSCKSSGASTEDESPKETPSEKHAGTQAQTDRWEACPAVRAYGDPKAPNQLVFENDYGRRIIHVEQVAATLDRRSKGLPKLGVDFPETGYGLQNEDSDTFRIGVYASSFDANEKVNTGGYFSSRSRLEIDCMVFNLGERRLEGRVERTHFVAPVDGAGELKAAFSFGSEQSDTTITGHISTTALEDFGFRTQTDEDAPSAEPVDLATLTSRDLPASPQDDFKTCPTSLIYGSEPAQAVVQVSTRHGERVYRLPRVRATLDDRELHIELPAFGFDMSQADLKEGSSDRMANDVLVWAEPPTEGSAQTAARVRASMRKLAASDCLVFPRHFDLDEQTLTLDSYRAPTEEFGDHGELVANGDVVVAEHLDGRFSLRVSTDQLVRTDVYRPISDDTGVLGGFSNDQFESFDEGVFVYYPDTEVLQAGLSTSSSYKSFTMAMPAKTGVYVGKPSFRGPMPVIVVETFEGAHLRVLEYVLDKELYDGDVPDHPDELMAAPGLSTDVLEEKGEVRKRIETRHLVRVPTLAPVDLGAVGER